MEFIKQIPFGDDLKTLEVADVYGGGGAIYIRLDNYHHGQVVYQQGAWRAYLHPTSELCLEDKQEIERMVTEAKAAEGWAPLW